MSTIDRRRLQDLLAGPDQDRLLAALDELLTPNYLEARQDWTPERVIAHFRKVGRTVELVNYVYIVDAAGRLVGVASMREVLVSDPQTP